MVSNTKITPDDHSDIVGGSTAARVLACPGSVKLVQGVKQSHKQRIATALQNVKDEMRAATPNLSDDEIETKFHDIVEKKFREETTSSYAAEGTGLHEAIAWLLENDALATDMIGKTFEGILITEDLYDDAIKPALDGFDDYLEQVCQEDNEDMQFLIETRCAFPGIPGVFGTTDVLGKTTKRALVWDWKFGAGVVVSPEDNAQLKFYGCAAINTLSDWFGAESGVLPDDFRIDFVISQPRVGDGTPQIWTTTFATLVQFQRELVDVVAKASKPDAPVKQGPHCKWCSAKLVCPAKKQMGQRIADRIGKVRARDEDKPLTDAITEIGFTPDDLSNWIKDAQMIEEWISAVRSIAYKELENGRQVTGYELDQGYSNAAWSADAKTVERRLGSLGIGAKERRNVKIISPTQARKLVKGDVRKEKLLEKIIERPLGSKKMVIAGTAKNPVRAVSTQIASIASKLADEA